MYFRRAPNSNAARGSCASAHVKYPKFVTPALLGTIGKQAPDGVTVSATDGSYTG
ncbi:MAG: hypothetical protein OXH03_06710 [Bacteroidetes bacterium]|nr:hypothetical protein [Bacteroidota bacterium]